MIKALAFGTSILALETPFSREMLSNGKFGLFFKKDILSINQMINYCEKNSGLMDIMKEKSPRGISNKYNWDFITSEYQKVFKSLVSKRNKS